MNREGADAVVFAYHDVGVRGIETLLERGVNVRLVVTHADDPNEEKWFASVAECARRYDIECVTPAQNELLDLVPMLDELAPDFIFSFYYRHMIPAALLAKANRGALNLHGSLLPRYRGRAPVNWAVLAGESETGASLHYMTAEPDAGDLVGTGGGADPSQRYGGRGDGEGRGGRRTSLVATGCRNFSPESRRIFRWTSPPGITAGGGGPRTGALTGPAMPGGYIIWCAPSRRPIRVLSPNGAGSVWPCSAAISATSRHAESDLRFMSKTGACMRIVPMESALKC